MIRKSHGAADIAASAGNRPIVMLTGRANVGKSTLFNRIVGGARAIVSPIAGTTRDLNIAITAHEDREFAVVDSGGLEPYALEPAGERATEEALRALGAADLIVFVMDARTGVSSGDENAISLVREIGRPMIVAANKVDNPQQESMAAEAWRLGVKSVTFISAAHGRGVSELLEQISGHLPQREAQPKRRPTLRLALIGRPNVGKSSLLNRLSGFARAIVDERPGTTRDPVEVPVQVNGHTLSLIDTAGIRRPTKVEGELEHHSVGRAIGTIRRAEVLALVIDAAEGFTDQDARLARLVDSNDRALVVVCNKWDAVAKAGRRVRTFIRNTRERYPFLDFAPIVITSARTGDGVDQIIPAASRAGEAWRAEFRTVRLNRILAEATAALDPPLVGERRLKPMYVTQVSKSPPRLAVFCNLERDIPSHYTRFLEGRFRAALDLAASGTPLRIEIRRAKKSRTGPGRIGPHSGRASPIAELPAREHNLEAGRHSASPQLRGATNHGDNDV
jgi:GTP-binding protein